MKVTFTVQKQAVTFKRHEAIEKRNREANGKFYRYSKEPKFVSLSLSMLKTMKIKNEDVDVIFTV